VARSGTGYRRPLMSEKARFVGINHVALDFLDREKGLL